MANNNSLTIISSNNTEEEKIFLEILKNSFCDENKISKKDVEIKKYGIFKNGFKIGIVNHNRTLETIVIIKTNTHYLDADDLCELNIKAQTMFEEEGIYGVEGIRERNLLESIPNGIQMMLYGDEAYPTIISKCSFLWFSLAKNHCFMNGNKRTALLASLLFLKINGYSIDFETDELYDISIKIANGDMDKTDIIDYLKGNVRIDMEVFKDIGEEISIQ